MPIKLAHRKTAPRRAAAPEKDRLDVFVEELNKMMKGVGRIDRGRDITWIDPPRIRTGILGLDVVSRGGLPRGGLVQFWGPFSSGKTTTAMHVMKAEQRAGRPVMFAAGEGFVKDWARKNGVWIPYSKDEYEATDGDADLEAQMKAYDESGEEAGFGTVAVAQHVHGDGLLEAVSKAVKSNLFSVVVVDSLAILRNTRQIEEMEVGQEEMGGGGQITMFNRFLGKCFSALNAKYSETGELDMYGNRGNSTCILCINQARIKMGGMKKGPGQVSYQPVGGEGLKHAWHVSVEFRKGEELGEQESIDGKQNWTPWGCEIRVRTDKCKIGPKGRSAGWDLYTEDHESFTAGSVDTAKEVRIWGVHYNVIEQMGAWYVLPGGKRVNGKDSVDALLREDPALCTTLEDQIIEAARR